MKINKQIENLECYLNGFNDVYEHKSKKLVVLGFLKILSYVFVIPVLIANNQYWKNKNVLDFQNEIDSKLTKCLLIKNDISKIFENTINPDKKQSGNQDKMIDYLINKLVNFEVTDDKAKEQQRFEKVFHQLTFESQEKFFRKAGHLECMELALTWIPNDIKFLNFISGPEVPVQCAKMNRTNSQLIANKLPEFNNLEKIRLNVKGLGFYTDSIDNCIEEMIQGGGDVVHHDPRTDFNIDGATYAHHNDNVIIISLISNLKKVIKNNSSLEWEFNLYNYGLSYNPKNDSKQQFGKDEGPEKGHLFHYLKN